MYKSSTVGGGDLGAKSDWWRDGLKTVACCACDWVHKSILQLIELIAGEDLCWWQSEWRGAMANLGVEINYEIDFL